MLIASMWHGPSIADVGNSCRIYRKINHLVVRIKSVRPALDAAEKAIADVITGSAAEKQDKAKKIFAACSIP